MAVVNMADLDLFFLCNFNENEKFVKNHAKTREIRPHMKSRGIFVNYEVLHGMGNIKFL